MQNNENATAAFNRDVVAMVRVARLANALAFAGFRPDAGAFVPCDVRQRQLVFGAYLTAGYLYEAVRLVDDLAGKYSHLPEFEGLIDFALKVRRRSNVLDEFNRNPGLTMDPSGDLTMEGIGKCHIDIDELVDSPARGCPYEYSHAVSRFDFDLMVVKLRPHMNEEEINDFPKVEMPRLVKAFHAGARKFVAALHTRARAAAEADTRNVTA